MVKSTKPKKCGRCEEPLKVNGSFMDIWNAAVKNADANTPKYKKEA